MWWKILLAVLLGAYFVSPVDISVAHINVDDIIALVGSISSIVAAVSQHKNREAIEQKKADDRIKF